MFFLEKVTRGRHNYVRCFIQSKLARDMLRIGVFNIDVLTEAQRYGWSNCPLCDIILPEAFMKA